jgi:recombinational DNA repair ATPase RecF
LLQEKYCQEFNKSNNKKPKQYKQIKKKKLKKKIKNRKTIEKTRNITSTKGKAEDGGDGRTWRGGHRDKMVIKLVSMF